MSRSGVSLLLWIRGGAMRASFVPAAMRDSRMTGQMSRQISGNSQESEARQSVVAPPARAPSWYERIMAALVCGSESELRQFNALLRTGLGIACFFEVATWLEIARFE